MYSIPARTVQNIY